MKKKDVKPTKKVSSGTRSRPAHGYGKKFGKLSLNPAWNRVMFKENGITVKTEDNINITIEGEGQFSISEYREQVVDGVSSISVNISRKPMDNHGIEFNV